MFDVQTVEQLDGPTRKLVVDAIEMLKVSGVIQLEVSHLEKEFVAQGGVDEPVESVHRRLIELRFRKGLLTELEQSAFTYGEAE